MGKISERYSFDNGRGQKLSGIIDAPEGATPRAYGLFAPCFTCIKESHGAVKICRELALRGIAMLRFDMTGLGNSQGDFADTNFTTRISDIVAATQAFTKSHGAPKILVGHSISGTAALSAIHRLPAVEILATIGSPQDPQTTIEKFRSNGLMDETGDDIVINVLGRPTPFRKSFVTDLLSQNVAEDTAKIDRKLLVFHAPNDAIVSYGNAKTIIARAGKNAELVRLDDSATHLFEKGDDDAAFIAEKIAGALN